MNTSRRNFLKAAGAVGLFNIVPAHVLRGATAPSNQLTRAIIGCGVIARDSENHIPYKGTRLLGLCDVNQVKAKEGLALAERYGHGKVKDYGNFLKLLEDKDVDIVHICTPPHWHGLQSVMAARAGKDVWCEKPMTRTVGEGKRVMEYIKSKKCMFRLNTFFRYSRTLYGLGLTAKPLKQLMENGLIASPGTPVRCVVGGGQGFDWKFHWSGHVNVVPEPVPETLDWDMWLGPAPWKPYNRDRAGTNFRGYWDYDSGGLGDMAQHYLDPVQYIMGKDETSPVKIAYVGPKQHPEAVGRFDRITLTYADGSEIVLDGNGSLRAEPFIKGDRAAVYPRKRMVGADGSQLDMDALLKPLPEPAPQQVDFLDSVRTRKRFCLNEETGFRSSTIFNLAIVAERLGRDFEFDPVRLCAVNDPAADALLVQTMREPWETEFYKD